MPVRIKTGTCARNTSSTNPNEILKAIGLWEIQPILTASPQIARIPNPVTVASPRGSGSVVEHLLAKEKVAGSNPVFRSRVVEQNTDTPRTRVRGVLFHSVGKLQLLVEKFQRFGELLDPGRSLGVELHVNLCDTFFSKSSEKIRKLSRFTFGGAHGQATRAGVGVSFG
jgi:hypothetical protein